MCFHAISYICCCYLISSLSRCICHLIPVYVSTDWIFSRRSLLESSTATEQLLRHTSFPPWDLHLRTWWGTNAFFSVLQMSHFFSSMWYVCVCVGAWQGFIVLKENDFMWSVKSAASSQEQKPWWYRELSRSFFVVISLCLLWHVCSSDYSAASIMWHETWGSKVWAMLIGF